jgi:hypothetical protein
MIKKIESYLELADPQLQPRYSGIPTFFRLPHSVRLDEVDIGLVGVLFDDGATIFAHACKLGLEGIVSKRRDDPAFKGGQL